MQGLPWSCSAGTSLASRGVSLVGSATKQIFGKWFLFFGTALFVFFLRCLMFCDVLWPFHFQTPQHMHEALLETCSMDSMGSSTKMIRSLSCWRVFNLFGKFNKLPSVVFLTSNACSQKIDPSVMIHDSLCSASSRNVYLQEKPTCHSWSLVRPAARLRFS